MRGLRGAVALTSAILGAAALAPSPATAVPPLATPAVAAPAAAPAAAGAAAALVPSPPVAAAAVRARCQLSSTLSTDYQFEGRARTFKLVVPPGATSDTPVFVSLHGATGSATSQERLAGLPQGAGIMLYPQALNNPPGTFWDAAPGSVDVRFVAALVGQLHWYGCGSPETTSVSGFSLGAMMVARLLCHSPQLFSSAAMVAGALPPTPGCRIGSRTSVLVVHGTADQDVPYDGSMAFWLTVFGGGAGVSAYPGVDRAQMAARWQEAKGCPAGPLTARPAALLEYDLTSCGTAPTRAAVAAGGGHNWDPPGLGGYTASRLIGMLQERGVPGRVVTPDRPAVVQLADGPASVFVNVTTTAAGGSGYTVLYPCAADVPLASTNSYVFGGTTATLALVRTDERGQVCVRVAAPTHVIIDNYGPAGAIEAHAPTRLADSRKADSATAGQRVPAGGVLRVRSSATGGSTVFANVTATSAMANGFTTVFACDGQRPTASTNNFVPGRTSAGFAVVGTDARGDFCVYTSAAAHLVVDAYAETDSMAAHLPQRLADTRTIAQSAGGMAAGTVMRVRSGSSSGSTAFANVTVTGARASGYTTVFPCDEGRPATSSSNYGPTWTSANAAVVRVDALGDFCVYTSATAHIVVDYYGGSEGMSAPAPARAFDSRSPW